MKKREELIKQHELLLMVYEKVKDMLAGYPNVVDVGIGLKEKDGKLTDEGCIKIIVKEKINETDLDPDKIIPKEVDGVKTDVIIQTEKSKLAVCAEDQSSYRPIKGGIRISNSKVGGEGTLGCLAQLDSDHSWVILSNHHVLYGASGQDGDEIGQPRVGCSWCCKTNVVAKNADKDEPLDCAIAKVADDIAIDNSIIEIGNILGSGAAAAVNGERVRKRGVRTGLTSGTISYINPASKEITITPNPSGGPADNPGGCTNYEAGKTIFAYYGDSGSAVVNNNNEVIALLHAIDAATKTKGYANDIIQIQTKMKITVKTTSGAPGRTPASETITYSFPDQKQVVLNDGWVEYIEERLEDTANGRAIIKLVGIHQEEVFNLVNKHRPVMTMWHRKQGPGFVAAFGRSVKNPEYIIPSEINRISLQNLLMSMSSVLEEHGSEQLREAIRDHASEVIMISRRCTNAEEFLKVIEQLDNAADVQAQMTNI